jgi:hypothetical protein
MKRVIPAASLLTLGVASVLVPSPAAAEEGQERSWKLSASLSGFYDDNIYSRSAFSSLGTSAKVGSFGLEFSPGVTLKARVADSTDVTFKYQYTLDYYDRAFEHYTHTHRATLDVKHSFNDNVSATLSDSFYFIQAPSQFAQTAQGTDIFRATGDNYRNIGSIGLAAQLAPLWFVDVNYQNSIYRYQDASYRISQDRIEHLPGVDLRYQASPNNSISLNYQYGIVDFDNANPVAPTLGTNAPAFKAASLDYLARQNSKARNHTVHNIFLGLDSNISPTIQTSLRGGVQIFEYDSIVGAPSNNDITPYVDASISWDFAKGATVTVGVTHKWANNDIIGNIPTLPVRGSEVTVAYGSLKYLFTPKVVGSVFANYQHGTYIGGGDRGTMYKSPLVVDSTGAETPFAGLDGASEDFFSVGGRLQYNFSTWLGVYGSYRFTRLRSDINSTAGYGFYNGRDFSDNRVDVGVIATY